MLRQRLFTDLVLNGVIIITTKRKGEMQGDTVSNLQVSEITKEMMPLVHHI
jgi:hypothetical protein